MPKKYILVDLKSKWLSNAKANVNICPCLTLKKYDTFGSNTESEGVIRVCRELVEGGTVMTYIMRLTPESTAVFDTEPPHIP